MLELIRDVSPHTAVAIFMAMSTNQRSRFIFNVFKISFPLLKFKNRGTDAPPDRERVTNKGSFHVSNL